jgi:hypothetical protein
VRPGIMPSSDAQELCRRQEETVGKRNVQHVAVTKGVADAAVHKYIVSAEADDQWRCRQRAVNQMICV